jgi:phosphatidylinositol alpha-1,6-mannosyltransferase
MQPMQAGSASKATSSAKGERGRVLFVTSSFPRWGGDSTTPFILHLAQDLQALGWRVRVLAPHAAGARSHEYLEGVEVRRFRYWWPAGGQTVCYSGGALVNLRQRKIDFLKIPPLLMAELWALLVNLWRGDIDVVHSHWILPQGLLAGIAAAVTRTPHVATIHGGDVFALRGAFFAPLKCLAMRLANVTTANSTATLHAALDLGAAAERAVRVPMGASGPPPGNTAAAENLRATLRHGAGPLLIFVGRLIEEKGAGDLLHAVAMLARSHPDLRALLVGDGQEREELLRLAESLGVIQRVTFTGWVDPSAVSAYLAAADVFVGPSKRSSQGWQEAQGLTFVEAMLCGVPVIATDSGGISDIVQHEVTGLVVPQADPASIALAVERLLRDGSLRTRLIAAAATHARADYTRTIAAARFSALYESVRGRANTNAGGTHAHAS